MRADEIHPGDLIGGKYRVRAILGRSHGLMVEAFHTEFDQRVVIKILLAGQGDDREIERFRREARTFAKLESEHAARIIDVGAEPDGSFYLVRQYLEGVDLGTYVQQNGPLPLVDAVLSVLQVAEAVAETHSHGIIVRELQPSHLFLTQRPGGGPLVKISDFGTAKLMRDAAAPGVGGEFTATAMFGLSPYSSPELVRKARDVDVRADVWSLGAILYELCTGRPPFSGEAAFLMLQITREDPTPASQLQRGLPPELDQIIGWALARDVDARFKNVHALAHALTPYAPPEGLVLIDRIGQIAEGDRNRRRGGSVPPPAPSFPSGRPPRAPVTLPPPSMPAQPPPKARPPARSRPVDESVTDVRMPPSPRIPLPSGSAGGPPPGQPVGAAQLTDGRGGVWSPSTPPISSTPQSLATTPSASRASTARRLVIALIGLIALLVPLLIVLLVLKRGPSHPALESTAASAAQARETASAAPAETATAESAASAAPTDTGSAAPAASGAPSATASAAPGADASSKPSSRPNRAPPPPPPPPPAANAGGGSGTLLAVAVGGTCAFQVNGAAKGSGSSLRLSLKPGSYSVVCRPPTGATKAKSVTVRSGETAMAAFKL